MTDQEKKELREISILKAFEKVKALASVRALLWAAESALRNHPEFALLKKKISDLHSEVPGYADQFMREVIGIDPEEYDYYEPNDYDRIRVKDARERGFEFTEPEYEEEELGYEDPLKILARLRGEKSCP